MCVYDVFLDCWFVGVQVDMSKIDLTSQNVVHLHSETEWEARRINLGGEGSNVTSANVCKDAGGWVHGRERMKGAEETASRLFRKPLFPSHSCHPVTADTDAPNQNIKTGIHNEGGVEVGELHLCCQVFES